MQFLICMKLSIEPRKSYLWLAFFSSKPSGKSFTWHAKNSTEFIFWIFNRQCPENKTNFCLGVCLHCCTLRRRNCPTQPLCYHKSSQVCKPISHGGWGTRVELLLIWRKVEISMELGWHNTAVAGSVVVVMVHSRGVTWVIIADTAHRHTTQVILLSHRVIQTQCSPI